MHWNPLDYDSTFEDASRRVADRPEKDNFEAPHEISSYVMLRKTKPLSL